MFESVRPDLSVQAYLDSEKSSKERREYLGGYLYAMAGGTGRHNRISLNVAATFLGASSSGCRVYQEGMKLRIGEAIFYYPDVMVVCGKEQPDPYFETEPCVLVEVLSPSTKQTDLREKMLEYKRLPSLETYLIVDPDSLFIRHFWCDDGGAWQQQDITGSGDIVLPCLESTLTLSQVYQNVF